MVYKKSDNSIEMIYDEISNTYIKKYDYNNLSEDKQKVLDAIKQGDNLLITGEAGSGKSHLIDYIKNDLPNVIVSASTGVASFNIKGLTIHSLLHIGICDYPIELLRDRLKQYTQTSDEFNIYYEEYAELINNCKILIIDEVSMISDKVLSYINKALQILRNNKNLFGGVQILLFGDFLQLPPVLKDKYENSLLDSDLLKLFGFKVGYLYKNFRQSNDKTYKNILSLIRQNTINLDKVADLLNTRIVDKNNIEDLEFDLSYIKLVSTNAEVTRINTNNLQKLNTESFKICQSYRTLDNSKLKDFEYELEFKINCKVMILKNFDIENGVVNGALGILRGRDEGQLKIELDSGFICWIPETYTSGDLKRDGIIYTLSTVKVGYAFTIHKSQGLQFDKILVYNKKLFTDGLFYTAISRVKTLEGLNLTDKVTVSMLHLNSKYCNFYNYLSEKFKPSITE